jgi:hypothetical protein
VALSWDSLKANQAVLRLFAASLSAQSLETERTIDVVLSLPCGLHLLALIRKPLLLAVPGYWTAVVRLGHLFEGHQYNLEFKLAMRKVIAKNFKYCPVQDLPEFVSEYIKQKRDLFDLWRGAGFWFFVNSCLYK